MRKIKVVILALMLLIPINVYAFSATPQLSCTKSTLSPGESTTCKYSVSISGGHMSAISASYTFDSSNLIVSVNKIGDWWGNPEGNKIDYVDYNDHTGSVDIANFFVKAVSKDVYSDISTNLKVTLLEIGDSDSVAHKYTTASNAGFTIKANAQPTTKKQDEATTTTTKKQEQTTTKKTETTKNTTTKNNTSSTTTTQSETTTMTTYDETTTYVPTTTKKIVDNKPVKGPNILIIILLLLIMIVLLVLLIKAIKEKRENDLYG